MQQIASDDEFLDHRVRACGMCKYYLLSLRRRGQSRRVGVGYFASNQEARAWSESVRESVSSFTLIEMPALIRPLRAWGSRKPRTQKSTTLLNWRVENGAVAIDTSHIESLCMRFAQQIRWLRRGFVGGLPRASEP